MKLLNKSRLQNKLTMVPLFGFAIGLAVTFLCVVLLIRLYLDNYLLSQVVAYSQQISTDITSLIDRDREIITAFTLSDTLGNMDNKSRMTTALERLLSRNKNFLEGYVINLDGQTIAGVSRLQIFTRSLPSIQEQLIFQEAKKGGIGVSGWENFTEKYRPYWYMAVPIEKYPGAIQGVLVVTIDLRRFEDTILTSQAAKYGDPILIDRKGNVLVHLDRSKLGTNWSNLEVVQRVLRGEIGTAHYYDEKHQYVLAAFQPLEPYDWGLIVQVPPKQTVYIIRNKVILLFGLMTVAMFIITGFLTYFAAGKVVAPLKDLTQATQEFGCEKKLNYLPVSGNDEIAQLSASFYEMAASLSESDKQRAQYISMIAHDLRNPLTSIKEIFNILQADDIAESEKMQSLSAIKNRMELVHRMVDDLLEFSRLDLGQIHFNPETVSVKYLCQDILAGYRQQNRDIILKPFADEICVWADPVRLQQIIQNVLDNCLKHTPAGTTITIDCQEKESTVRIAISDNGPGITPEVLNCLFEPFKNGGRTKGSYGLGMAIAKKLAMGMNGNIFVASEINRGSTFSILLPRYFL
jgi:signal transduction histidine kinase